MVSNVLSYTGRKIRQLSPTLYNIGGRVVRTATAPVRWAIRNPVKALSYGALASGIIGFGMGLTENPLDALQGGRVMRVVNTIKEHSPEIVGSIAEVGTKGVAGGVDASEYIWNTGVSIAKGARNLGRAARLGYRLVRDVRSGNLWVIPGYTSRALMHGARAAGHLAFGAPYQAGRSLGHIAQSTNDLIVRPSRYILNPVLRAIKGTYYALAPHQTIMSALESTGFRDAPSVVSAAAKGAVDYVAAAKPVATLIGNAVYTVAGPIAANAAKTAAAAGASPKMTGIVADVIAKIPEIAASTAASALSASRTLGKPEMLKEQIGKAVILEVTDQIKNAAIAAGVGLKEASAIAGRVARVVSSDVMDSLGLYK